MPDPFITTTDLVGYIGRGGTADPGAIIAVDAACDIVRTIAEQQVNAGTSTITVDGTGTDALLLPEWPAGTVGTVTVAGSTVTDYALDTERGLLLRVPGDDATTTTMVWPAGRQNIVVTYTHGYEPADVPRDVRMVALAIAARLAIQGPALQETTGETSVRYAVASTDLTLGERAILRKHRRI